ncbi:hypothetical protein Tco_1377158 [Tanacetum coccineum]
MSMKSKRYFRNKLMRISHEAIVDVTRMFDQVRAAKEYMRKAYAECKDIPQEKRDVIDNFLEAEAKWMHNENK